MKTIAEFQKAAYALAKANCEYKQPCPSCNGKGELTPVPSAHGGGHVSVDPRSPTRIAARLERIHRAIAEAGECVEKGQMAFEWVGAIGMPFIVEPAATVAEHVQAGWKPQGFPIALATVFLRLCELAESLGHEAAVLVGWSSKPSVDTPEQTAAALAGMHMHVADIYSFETFGGIGWDGKRELDEALTTLVLLADALGIDLNAMAEIKLEYERGRK